MTQFEMPNPLIQQFNLHSFSPCWSKLGHDLPRIRTAPIFSDSNVNTVRIDIVPVLP